MKVEIFALCDAATDNHGKLNLLGTFDQIHAREAPVVHPGCAIALRLRFDKMEEGVHRVELQVIDQDGQPVFPPMKGEVGARMDDVVDSVAVNMILNFQNMRFEQFEDYQIDLKLDDRLMGSIPLRVREMPSPAR